MAEEDTERVWDSEGLTGAERRRAARYPVDAEATLVVLSRSAQLDCRLLDLSASGCQLFSHEPYRWGARLRVEIIFRLRGFSFRFNGITQWSDGCSRIGIRFLEASRRRVDELSEALEEVREECEAELRRKAEAARAEQAATAARAKESISEESRPFAAKTPVGGGQTTVGTGRERRVHARLSVEASVTVHLIKVNVTLEGRVLDLSLGGCRILCTATVRVGIYTRVEVDFALGGENFRLGGVIQGLYGRQTLGIRFLDISPRKREQLQTLIAELSPPYEPA